VLFWILCGFGGVLWGFFEVNFHIAFRSAVQRVFCCYMISVVLLLQCAVTTFGVGVYCIVLQEGQSVTGPSVWHLTEGKQAHISLNIVLDVSR
jgi:hypothetical protein